MTAQEKKRRYNISPDLSAFLWGLVFGVFVWLLLLGAGASDALAVIVGVLTLGSAFIFVRTHGSHARRMRRGRVIERPVQPQQRTLRDWSAALGMLAGFLVGGSALAAVLKELASAAGCIAASCPGSTPDGVWLGRGEAVTLLIGAVVTIGAPIVRRSGRVLLGLESLALVGVIVAIVMVAIDGADVHTDTGGAELERIDVGFLYPLWAIACALLLAAAACAARSLKLEGKNTA